MKQLALLPLVILLLTSCLKDELPVEPYDRGDLELIEVAMGNDYENQVWFNLSDKAVVSTNDRFDFDISFDCITGDLYLNSAVAMQASSSPETDFSATPANADLRFKSDHHSGYRDSLAVGSDFLNGQVFVIDLGYNIDGTTRGKRKIQLVEHSSSKIAFRYGKLNDSEGTLATVLLDSTFNKAYYSFSSENQVQIEPAKNSYDICFTTYVHNFYSPYIPYLVSGALLNPYHTMAAQTELEDFAGLDFEHAASLTFSDSSDVIGYDWKYYDLEAGVYYIDANQVFVIRDQQGVLHKMHFLDFYSDEGITGYPSFELKTL